MRQPDRAAALSLLTALLLGLAPLSSVLAQVLEGGAFAGTHEAGGPVHFVVSQTGGQIEFLEIEGLAGGGCSWGTVDLTNWGGSIDIVDRAFSASNADGDTIQGRFITALLAEGTVELTDPEKGCQTGPLRWVVSANGAA